MSAPFAPFGKSMTIPVSTTASSPIQCGTIGDMQSSAYRLVNLALVPVFLMWGPIATPAVLPVNGMLGPGIWLAPNSVEVLTFAPVSFFSAVCASGSGTLCIAVGSGL